MTRYGGRPTLIRSFDITLPEMMFYQYLPVVMPGSQVMLPPNVECCREMIGATGLYARNYKYVYLTAKKGWASPGNPLNRPGWHCDGFGSDDLNFIWWRGVGTVFAVQEFNDISDDHFISIEQFKEQIKPEFIRTGDAKHLYMLDSTVVHAPPEIKEGGMRQFIKISLSNDRYNLVDNSHNYLFDYDWKMHPRSVIRNDPHRAQKDSVSPSQLTSS